MMKQQKSLSLRLIRSILFASYTDSFCAGSTITVFFVFTMAAITISQLISLSSDSDKATNAAASIFVVIDRELKIDPSAQEMY
ncbi:hypothetical protein DY000_02055173 [Brassica cretica]|uniref:Uncharacterized protein n=1 Tax=Brassica cretica TaxID=69181 RepID=A0ABQ7A973_BRACR|nr:hypothetical protein DY000_02055173 [Brassica cretica]